MRVSCLCQAPEVYGGPNRSFPGYLYNERADTFSFAVLMYELSHRTLIKLTARHRNGKKDSCSGWAARVAEGHRPALKVGALPQPLLELITKCWAQKPHDRPSMAVVLGVLREIEKSGAMQRMDQDWDAETAAQCSCGGGSCVVC